MVEIFRTVYLLLKPIISLKEALWFLFLYSCYEAIVVAERSIPGVVVSLIGKSVTEQLYYVCFIIFLIVLQISIDVKLDQWIWYRHLLRPSTVINKHLFPHLLGLDPDWHQKESTGSTASSIPKGIGKLIELNIAFSFEFTSATIQLVLSLFTLAFSSRLTLIPITCSIVAYVWLTLYFNKQTKPNRDKVELLEKKAAGKMIAGVQALADIIFSGNPEEFKLEHNDIIDSVHKLEMESSVIVNFANAVRLYLAKGTILLVSFIIYLDFQSGVISQTVALWNMTIVITLFTSVSRFTRIADHLEKVGPAVSSLHKIIEAKPTISSGNIELTKTGEIVVSNLHYTYEGTKKPVFNGLNLTIKPGQFTALVGPSGAGKSTLAKLFTKFYTGYSGSITINGIDINEFTLDSLRNAFVYVLQAPSIFMESISYNVLCGIVFKDSEIQKIADLLGYNPSSFTVNDIIRLALDKVNLTDKFPSLEDVTAERGINISGGEGQRVAMARALVKAWYLMANGIIPIVVLDEPTSALDPKVEKTIMEAVKFLKDLGASVIVIAHRLQTIFEADQIFVFGGGKIVESGNHSDLMSLNGHYAKLVEMTKAGK